MREVISQHHDGPFKHHRTIISKLEVLKGAPIVSKGGGEESTLKVETLKMEVIMLEIVRVDNFTKKSDLY